MSDTPLRLFNSMTRQLEVFEPVHPGEARVYTCGPTVYNYQHIGNMRAYIFADTLGRVLSYKGYDLRHVINITDVGHLTSDADAGDDKMERAASAAGKSAWDIAKFYTDAYWRDIERLNIRQPAHWSIATDFVERMIAYAKRIADKHCYQLDSGLYFDTSTVPDYGRLARAQSEAGESRIDPVDGKRHAADFAIWRTTPPGETRQMEWDSPWGRGAPGWHLECSVMSEALLGLPFDIHTGGIDHREIHHPNEIAQNQAHCGGADSGARIWMHNNFLIDRSSKDSGGKMSKSTGEFLTLQALIDRGFHPLAFRLMCLQAHYRSELEFSWENLAAAQTRLKRIARAINKRALHYDQRYFDLEQATGAEADELRSEIYAQLTPRSHAYVAELKVALSDDLNTVTALTVFDRALEDGALLPKEKAGLVAILAEPLGLKPYSKGMLELREETCPSTASLTETEIEHRLAERKAARAAKNFATSDHIRDELAAAGVEVMDGDPLGWDWKLVVD